MKKHILKVIMISFLVGSTNLTLANTLLTESTLKQCIIYTNTMDQQQSLVNELDNQINTALNTINNSGKELNVIKENLKEVPAEQQVELVNRFNNLNDERNQAINLYNEAHQKRKASVAAFNAVTDSFNNLCVGVKVNKGIYDNACNETPEQGYCNTFKFN